MRAGRRYGCELGRYRIAGRNVKPSANHSAKFDGHHQGREDSGSASRSSASNSASATTSCCVAGQASDCSGYMGKFRAALPLDDEARPQLELREFVLEEVAVERRRRVGQPATQPAAVEDPVVDERSVDELRTIPIVDRR